MSHPRIASGVVVLPDLVRVIRKRDKMGPDGDLIGVFGRGDKTADPFARRANGLLLSEDFARLEISGKPKGLAALATWVSENGPLNTMALYGQAAGLDRPFLQAITHQDLGFQDHLADWWLEKVRVVHFIGALVGLSSAIGDSGVVEPADWDDAIYMPEDSVRQAGGVVLGVIRSWEDAVRWQAFGLDFYVERALQPQVRSGWQASRGTAESADRAVLPLRPVLEYRWRSVLAPIYLQIHEALRRVSEHRMGAVLCRECGKPTLVLDGRKTSYCTPAEANRHKQRALYARNHGKTLPPRPICEVWSGGISGPDGIVSGLWGPIVPGLPRADPLDNSVYGEPD